MQTDLFGNVPEIVIDVHETKGKRMNAVKHLMAMLDKEGIKYVVQKIPVGDILGMNGIAIERKTVNDLVSTLAGSANGVPRLKRQVEALIQYEHPYLLIEDYLAIRKDPVRGCIYIPFSTRQVKSKGYYVTMERARFIHPSALDNLIASIRELGVEILEGFNAIHSAGIIHSILMSESKKKKDQRLPVIRTRKGIGSTNDEQEFFIAGIPGINVVRARALLEKFETPFEVLTRLDEWTQISGIGPKTVLEAKRLLHSRYEPSEPGESEN